MENERVWRPRTESERVWRPSMEIEREWRLRGQGKSAVCKNRITELHRTLDSPVNFGPGEEVPHLDRGAAHRRATSITGISGMAAVGGASIESVKDKWVNQESRTLDPEWRDPAGRAQKENNGSRRPYIRP